MKEIKEVQTNNYPEIENINHPMNNHHGISLENYLRNPNTVIRVHNFQPIVDLFKNNPKLAVQIIFSTTNCIDGRPVMLHNSSILLLRFLVDNNRFFNEDLLDEYISNYLNDPIRKQWFSKQDNRKISKKKIINWIVDYFKNNSSYSNLALLKESLNLNDLVDLLTEWSWYPWWWLGFVINFTDMVLKNRNYISEITGINENTIMVKIENFYKEYGHMFYYHSCNGNYGWDCKYNWCAAMKYFMWDQWIDSWIQKIVNKYILWAEWKRRSTILNGKHDEQNRITVVNREDNKIWVWIRNDVSTERELGSEQSFVLNLQLESMMFDAITSILFPDTNNIKPYLRDKNTESLKNHLGNINPKLWDHKIEIWTIVNGEENEKTTIDNIGVLLNKI